MKRLLVISIILLFFVNNFWAQKKASSVKPLVKKNTIASSKEENSTVNLISFNDISVTPDKGEAFIGGRFSSKGLLVKFSSQQKIEIKTIPAIRSIEHLVFLDEFNGWVSDNKQLYRTNDGGNTWQKFSDIDTSTEGAMSFLSNHSGWVVGRNSSLNKIEGLDYKILEKPETSSWTVKKLQFVSESSGWRTEYGLDDYHNFERTDNGGKTWKQIKIDEIEYINDFHFINENEGYAIADSKFYSTENKGETWNLVNTLSGKNFDNVFFLDRDIGWVANRDICRTNTGGITWKCKKFQEGNVDKIVFVNSIKGWLISDSEIFATDNGGESWKKIIIKP